MRKTFLLALGLSAVCSAHEYAPFTIEYRLLDRIAGTALQQPSKAEEAVAILKAILDAKADSVRAKFVEMSGFDAATSAQLALAPDEARCRAAEKLGELGAAHLDSAREALASFSLQSNRREQDPAVYWCAEAALVAFQVGLAPTRAEKIRVLEDALDPPSQKIHNYVDVWARGRLCDLGAAGDLPRIIQEILDSRQDGIAQQEIDSCRTKSEILARDPDRLKALTTVIFPNGLSGTLPPGLKPGYTDAEFRTDQLRGWALYQIVDMHTAEADHILTLYFAAVERLERDHPLHYEAYWQKESINEKWKAYGKKD
jgi:hypothetical protein